MAATKPKARKPVFTALTTDECWSLVRRNHIGRLAFLNRGKVDIEPVSYVAEDSWLFLRSGEGAKLEAFEHHPYVAFEVDEIDGIFDWRSVVAHGTVYLMDAGGVRVGVEAYERALRALRSVAPTVLTSDDPVPFRRNVYGVHVDWIKGRMAEQRRPSTRPRAMRISAKPRSARRRPDDGS